ncbi:Fe(3+)-hydroxamate ABC transporter permease FhuB [Burkholderia mayonis]|uniref:Fe(3+)-hydroxamate ABC transporter permease FhuB n=1 Tax=Burkholderia mayonis TaxID=1385591 RepID=UPI0009EA8114|nr:Fe(3+)-hydroxamate ABC transporter permease FhuB [Burkholderia mayonis]
MNIASLRASRIPSGSWLPPLCTAIALTIAVALSIVSLSALLPPALWWRALWSPDARDLHQIVVHDSWLPRLLVSWLCGAVLGLAGTVFQQVLRNPLAEPMTLGVSAGAQLALTVATLWAPVLLDASQWIAFGGALLAALIVFGLSWRSGLAPAGVAVAGLVVTLYCGSIGVALQLFYAPYLRGLFIWGGGSLVQQDWSNVALLASRLAIGGLFAFLLLKPMTLFGLDDANARGLGLPLQRMRLAALALAVALSAAVVGAVGVIGFVGLAAPALAQMSGARRLPKRLVIAPLYGALLLWLADQAVQQLSGVMGDLIPTGAATALFGAPLMLLLLARLHRATRLPARNTDASRARIVDASTLRRRALGLVLLTIAAGVLALDFGRDAYGWHFSALAELSRVAVWRVPRAVAAAAAGAMLAVAGTLMQRLTGNPLASPDVLGVSGGAALGLIVLVVGGYDTGHAARIAATAAGALTALLSILWFSQRSRFAPDRVLLAGIAIGALFQAVVAVAIASGGERATALLQWLAGSTYTITPGDAMHAAALTIALCALAPLCDRWLQILPLGDASARALGVATRGARFVLLMLVALLTAAATLVVGPLSFVGLTAPHFAHLLGARRPGQQALLAALIGMLIVVVSDWLGRALLMPRELPAGLVATLIGAPYLMWLLSRRR